ncbi:MAG: glycosyltransferase family 4 protein [Deltaproteobacteria bacterium]|nr:glycosyltransferase family 4 protein [Deltaproteobacteria bacterium]
MQIWVVTQYYPPEPGAPSARLSGLAAEWVRAGQDVVIFTGIPNHPDGVVQEGYRDLPPWSEREEDGVKVRRHRSYIAPNRGKVKRVAGMISFAGSVAAYNLLRPHGPVPDVIMASSPSFFGVGAAWLLSRRYGARFVFEVRDLWPAIFLQMDILSPGALYDLLERIELGLYRRADAVVTVTTSFAREIAGRGIDPDKLWVVFNGVSEADLARADAVQRGEAPAALRERLGIRPDQRVVLYLGNHGQAQALDQILDAARGFAPGEDVVFLFVGQGADKARLEALAAELGQVRFLPPVPHSETWAWYAMADVNVVCLKDIPDFDMFIPSKMFEVMAASRCAVGALRGEGAALMAESGSAEVVPSEDPEALRGALRGLLSDPARRARLGAAGRAFVEERFSHRRLAAQYLGLFERLTGRDARELPPRGA